MGGIQGLQHPNLRSFFRFLWLIAYDLQRLDVFPES